MKAKAFFNSDKSNIPYVVLLSSLQEYLNDKSKGLNLFDKIMLVLYSITTILFCFLQFN